MKKIIFLLLFVCFSFSFSQNKDDKRYFPVEYILKTSSDTIKTKIRNVGKFSNTKYYVATVLFKMKMRDSSGSETWVEPKDVEYIKITDENNTIHEYYASAGKMVFDNGFVEILYEGKNMNWYRFFSHGGLKFVGTDFLIDGRNRKIINESGFFNPSLKNSLKVRFAAYPDLLAMIDSWKTDDDLLKILQLYDKKVG
ncbi:hypothetical protein H9Q08_04205 [Chryseobacterium sp. PS-8]|uniref:GLPGLI family protein n=1 Tax=Chryseobacterium indicum TaxID=2766954 RepID=A0ABS9C1Z3_9FLAO|nr:hypothetical protein [Chryseobacterium sp. PS-8]MCF2218501.1 hypothetical protein [Chryseobacterium sp. PS-8]